MTKPTEGPYTVEAYKGVPINGFYGCGAEHKIWAPMADRQMDLPVACVPAIHTTDGSLKYARLLAKSWEMRELLRFLEDHIGWRGNGPEDKDRFYCEHCRAGPEDDWANIKHSDVCPVSRLRALLAEIDGDDQ